MAALLWYRLGCCLTGHDYVIASDRERMFLRCNRCGRTSRGLEIDRDLFRKEPRNTRAGTSGSLRGTGHSSLATR
jgi:hypothetical protein